MNITEDVYWKTVASVRSNDQLPLQKSHSMIYLIAVRGYEISEIELIGLFKYLDIYDNEEVKEYITRVIGSEAIKLKYPTGEFIDQSSLWFKEGINNPETFKEELISSVEGFEQLARRLSED